MYCETHGRESADHLPHARWALEHALARAGSALDALKSCARK